MRRRTTCVLLVSLLAALAMPLAGQKWEFGVGAAGGYYAAPTVTGVGGLSASTSPRNGWGLSGVLAHNAYGRLGGEIRYLFARNDLELSSGGQRASFQARSHAIGYELVVHATPFESRVRPFVAAGGGAKIYQGTGAERAYQPLSSLALLTRGNDVRPLISFGGGVKFALTRNIGLRVEFRDHMTRVPTKVITPNQGAKLEGWIHSILPMFSLMFLF